MKNLRKNSGITLIALIVTIIVLLILAGVSLRLIAGGDGIMNRASNAVDKNEIETGKERVELFFADKVVEYYKERYVNNNESYADARAYILKDGKVEEDIKDYYLEISDTEYTENNNPKVKLYRYKNSEKGITLAEGELSVTGEIVWNSEDGFSNLTQNSVASLAKNGYIKVFDDIAYDPESQTIASIKLPKGTMIEGRKIASLSLPTGTKLTGTIDTFYADDWYVISVNQITGEVKIVPNQISDERLVYEGVDGYNNAEDAMNAVAGIYKDPMYAVNSKCITQSDLEPFMRKEGSEIYYDIRWHEGLDFWVAGLKKIDEDRRLCGYVDYDNELLYKDCEYGGAVVLPVVTLKPDVELESSNIYYTERATETADTAIANDTSQGTIHIHNSWKFKKATE